jgi:NADH-quinone oxidoreductase subunit M
MGLPGLNGFVGEFTILLGTFGSEYLGFFFALFATLGVILAAVYSLYMYQKVFMGEVVNEENAKLKDQPLHWHETVLLVVIVIVIIWIGVYPAAFFGSMDASVNQLVQQVSAVAQSVVSR